MKKSDSVTTMRRRLEWHGNTLHIKFYRNGKYIMTGIYKLVGKTV